MFLRLVMEKSGSHRLRPHSLVGLNSMGFNVACFIQVHISITSIVVGPHWLGKDTFKRRVATHFNSFLIYSWWRSYNWILVIWISLKKRQTVWLSIKCNQACTWMVNFWWSCHERIKCTGYTFRCQLTNLQKLHSWERHVLMKPECLDILICICFPKTYHGQNMINIGWFNYVFVLNDTTPITITNKRCRHGYNIFSRSFDLLP